MSMDNSFNDWLKEWGGAPDESLLLSLEDAYTAGRADEREDRAKALDARAERTVTIRETLFYRHCAEIVRKAGKSII